MSLMFINSHIYQICLWNCYNPILYPTPPRGHLKDEFTQGDNQNVFLSNKKNKSKLIHKKNY